MRICQLLLQTYRREDFVSDIFRQMVHWEPDEQTIDYYENGLQAGLSKNEIMLQILNFPQSMDLYFYSSSNAEADTCTVAQRLQYLFSLHDEEFVLEIYRELLYREADPHSFGIHIGSLRQGVSRMTLINGFLNSEEWHILVSQSYLFSNRILAYFLSTLQGVERQ